MKICKFDGCDRPFQARELCNTHYQQLRNGRPLTPIQKPKTLEQSMKEFKATTSKGVTGKAVRSSATEYGSKVTDEAFEKWLMNHDAEVLMIAANTFAKDAPTSWRQDAAYELAEMAKKLREGR